MAKAETPKTKPKAKPKFTDKAQSERFIETARKLGVEETGEEFERTFKKIAPPKTRSSGQIPSKS
jgi:hypothetical protein